MRARKLTGVAVGLGLAVAGVVAWGAVIERRLPKLSEAEAGDAALLTRVREFLSQSEEGARDKLSAAVVQHGVVTEAHFGADATTEYEIGSITKTMTASVLADMVERGEVEATATLGEFLDLKGSPAATITLESLATHTSGLPRMAKSLRNGFETFLWLILTNDPSASSTVESLVRDAAKSRLRPGRFEYSNLGFSLLGQALAKQAGISFTELVSQRVFEPLGMAHTFAPSQACELHPRSLRGYSPTGKQSAPWTLGAEAPSGSVRSTLADMVLYLQAQMNKAAPGVIATEPIKDIGNGERIGYGWLREGESLTWHNGATGGFSSWISFDRNTGRGVVILSNTFESVDDLGRYLQRTDL